MGKLKSILLVALSNSTSIIAGIFIGFLVPKILTVTDYGMYKTFTLYMTYVGFFSLGIIDGIVLKYGGVDYPDIDRKQFRSYFIWYNIVHFIFAAILIICALFINNNSTRFILLMLALNMWAVNITGYFQQISQITQRFKEFSIRKILQNVLNILIVILLFVLHHRGDAVDYSVYVILLVLINVLLTAWYLYTYRDINFGEYKSLKSTKSEIVELMKSGFPLLFANLLSTLILTLDRQFVNSLFDKDTYAVYAFAYNMLSIVTVATSAFSIVLYPALKRTTKDKLEESYSYFIQIIIILVSLALVVFFPLCFIVRSFLPNYIDSLHVFRIVFPGLIISSAITVIMHNYYKTLGKNIVYFKRSLIVLVLSALANIIAYLIFKTTYAISIASIIVMVFWYIYVERYFVKIFNYSGKRNLLFILFAMIGFYFITAIQNIIIGAIVYICFIILISIVFLGKNFKKLLEIVR